jgi:putative glycerol-1-phosphate prenyltransferase
MSKNILSQIQTAHKNGHKLLAILLDPDKVRLEDIPLKVAAIDKLAADFILVGGSLLFTNILDAFVKEIKKYSKKPIVLFPGSALQISNEADGILFLQLISGRNPEYLIGNQVIAAPLLRQTQLEVISTGYMLIESGRETTASYISNTKPIPGHKPEIAMATALAGQYIGHQLIYLDGGSGALHPVPESLIEMVAKNVSIPLIVGGGIKNRFQLDAAYEAGADVVVIGTAFEDDSFQI